MGAHEEGKCLFPERWERLNNTLEKIDAMAEKVDDMHDRMFVDNGTDSHQTQLKTLTSKVSLILWVGSIIGGSMLVSIVTLFFKVLAKGI
jgi:uncharacterized membrane protein